MPSYEGGRAVPDVTFTFGHDSAAPRGARRALDPLLGSDDPIADAVRLTASELVTNVIQHTEDGGTMRAWYAPDHPLRLEVTDRTPASIVPTGLPPPDVAPRLGGRGLAIVEALSQAWGIDGSPFGKTVWAEFDRRRPDPAGR